MKKYGMIAALLTGLIANNAWGCEIAFPEQDKSVDIDTGAVRQLGDLKIRVVQVINKNTAKFRVKTPDFDKEVVIIKFTPFTFHACGHDVSITVDTVYNESSIIFVRNADM